MDLIEFASIASVFIAGLWIAIRAMENSVINQAKADQQKENMK